MQWSENRHARLGMNAKSASQNEIYRTTELAEGPAEKHEAIISRQLGRLQARDRSRITNPSVRKHRMRVLAES